MKIRVGCVLIFTAYTENCLVDNRGFVNALNWIGLPVVWDSNWPTNKCFYLFFHLFIYSWKKKSWFLAENDTKRNFVWYTFNFCKLCVCQNSSDKLWSEMLLNCKIHFSVTLAKSRYCLFCFLHADIHPRKGRLRAPLGMGVVRPPPDLIKFA